MSRSTTPLHQHRRVRIFRIPPVRHSRSTDNNKVNVLPYQFDKEMLCPEVISDLTECLYHHTRFHFGREDVRALSTCLERKILTFPIRRVSFSVDCWRISLNTSRHRRASAGRYENEQVTPLNTLSNLKLKTVEVTIFAQMPTTYAPDQSAGSPDPFPQHAQDHLSLPCPIEIRWIQDETCPSCEKYFQ